MKVVEIEAGAPNLFAEMVHLTIVERLRLLCPYLGLEDTGEDI
jgi:hypothetical protein